TNSDANSTQQSTFLSPGDDVAFTLSVPDDATTNLYFSIRMRTGITWAAIGLGSSKMKGSLMLMMYASSSGTNVTLSPRLCSGHSEPIYSSEILIESLAGTGKLDNTTYLFNGRCSNCRSWASGSVNVTSTAQDFVYGIGPYGDLQSDDPNAPLNYHEAYGGFTLDMTGATGVGGVPVIGTESAGTALVLSKTGKSDSEAMAHGIIMIICFVGVFPLGIVLLRLGNSVRWHLINQAIALVLTLVGTSLGMAASTSYNRSSGFNTPHQILGLIVFLLVVTQFVIGYIHHRIFKRTQQTTKLAPVHVQLGRVAIPLGILVAFTGFPLALAPQSDITLAVVVIMAITLFFGSFFAQKYIWKRSRRGKGGVGEFHEMR
ncbi:CBD9-like protein, partial [Thozetella sp. PMI_491]